MQVALIVAPPDEEPLAIGHSGDKRYASL
jgi:hypothetical protein